MQNDPFPFFIYSDIIRNQTTAALAKSNKSIALYLILYKLLRLIYKSYAP